MTNSRFTVAIHILTLLSLKGDEPVTSEALAASVNTNPVVIRRVLGMLRRHYLVTSQGGNGGGWRLVGDPEAITLRDVYRIMEDETLFAFHHQTPNPACLVGRNIQHALIGRYTTAQRAMEEELAHTTVADVLHDVMARAD